MSKTSFIFLFAFLSGLISPLGLITSQGLVLKQLSPFYLVGLPAISSALFIFLSNFYRPMGLSFRNLALTSILCIGGVSFWVAWQMHIADSGIIAVWLIVSSFAQPLTKWLAVELTHKYVTIQQRDSALAKTIACFDFGNLITLGAFCLMPQLFHVRETAGAVVLGYIALMVFLAWSFRQSWSNELVIGVQERPLSYGFYKDSKKLLLLFASFALGISVAKSYMELATRNEFSVRDVSLSESYVFFAAIGLAVVTISMLLEILIARSDRLRVQSPISYLKISILSSAAVVCALIFMGKSSPLGLWIFGEVIMRSLDRSVVGHAYMMITHSFTDHARSFIKLVQQVAANLLGPIGVIVASGFIAANYKDSHHIWMLLPFLGGLIVLARAVGREVSSTLVKITQSGNNKEVVHAITGLGRFYPSGAEEFLIATLERKPSKLITKVAAYGLCKARSNRSFLTLDRVFGEVPDEVQTVIVEAFILRGQYQDLMWLWRVAIEKKRSISQRARRLAMAHLRSLYGTQSIPILLDQLDSSDPRTVANMIEILGEFSDKQLMETFVRHLDHDEPRVVGNALIALYQFKNQRADWRRVAAKLLQFKSGPQTKYRASVIYAIGYCRDRSFQGVLVSLLSTELPSIERRGIFIALSRMGIPKLGAGIVQEFAQDPLSEAMAALFLFNTLPSFMRLTVLEHAYHNQQLDLEIIENIRTRILKSGLDFHEEILYLDRLTKQMTDQNSPYSSVPFFRKSA